MSVERIVIIRVNQLLYLHYCKITAKWAVLNNPSTFKKTKSIDCSSDNSWRETHLVPIENGNPKIDLCRTGLQKGGGSTFMLETACEDIAAVFKKK